MPRQLATAGDRLAFSNGIIVLALVSGALLVAFDATSPRSCPLFAVGLFASFTLSQAGMVVHHLRLREPRWRVGLVINLVGAIATSVVLVVVLASKFVAGAWVPTLVIPALTGVGVVIKRHYDKVARALALQPGDADGDRAPHRRRARRPTRPERPRTRSATRRRCGPTTCSR